MRTGGTARVGRTRFSIITPSLNQGSYLADTIRSVAAQGRGDVEHIVIDGGSTDDTVAVLEAHDHLLSYWQSAPDGGQPMAINTGLRRARGEIVAFLNSDDVYLPGALDAVARLADREPDAGWLLGGTLYFGDGAEDLWYPGRVPHQSSEVLYFGTYVPQQGQFWRRDVLERLGGFDESLLYCFDFDLSVRCALEGVRAAALARPVAGFRFHSASKTVASRPRQQADIRAVEERYLARVMAREGLRGRRARARYHGEAMLGEAREAWRVGNVSSAWRRVARVMRQHTLAVPSRAFVGTVQRLLGLRRA